MSHFTNIIQKNKNAVYFNKNKKNIIHFNILFYFTVNISR